MESLKVVKIGGNVVNNKSLLHDFLEKFQQLLAPKLIVHGGGRSASELCRKLDIPIKMNKGRRITDADSLDVAVMVYAGLINKKMVASLQALGCNALGLSGADLNTIPAQKRTAAEIDYGYVGDINAEDINTYFIKRLLDEQIVPVFPAITHDTQGQLLNTNADTIAASLAIALSKKYRVTLTYCFAKDGVLGDLKDESSLIEKLDREHFQQLKANGTIHEGMIPKMDTAFQALSNNVDRVLIKNAGNLHNTIGTELSL